MSTITRRSPQKTKGHSTEDGIAVRHDGISSLLSKMDFIFQTLRSRRISMSSLHAVTNLYVNRKNNLSLSELAANLGITTAAVTSVADSMEKLGLAKRTVNTTDRRLTHINLTHRGIAFAEWLHDTIGRDSSPSGLAEMTADREPQLSC